MTPSIKFLGLLILVALILASGSLFLMKPSSEETGMDEVSKSPTNAEVEVKVVETDITQGGTSKLPAGFPKSIPAEAANITESYRAVYAEKGVTQYTVSYTSQKSRDALWDIYSEFMKNGGYTVDASVTSKSLGQITGEKGNDILSVVVSSRGGLSLVQLNLLDRQ